MSTVAKRLHEHGVPNVMHAGHTNDNAHGSRTITRPRLIAAVDRAVRTFRVCVLKASVGYGKSVLLADVARLRGDIVPISVSREVRTLARFVAAVAEALRHVQPALYRNLDAAAAAVRDDPDSPEELATWFALQLGDAAVVIAIDDLHNCDDDPDVARFLIALIESTASSIRWIIASRTAAHLPLATWSAYDIADTALSDTDLKMTPAESLELLHDSGNDVSAEWLTYFSHALDGWPLGIHLAIKTSVRRPDLAAVEADTRELVFRFFVEGVWADLGAAERSFLEFVSVVNPCPIAGAEAVGFEDAHALSASLAAKLPFCRHEAGKFAVHDLFRDFVIGRVALREMPHRRALLRKAVALREAAEEYAGALECLSVLGDGPEIVAFADRVGFVLAIDALCPQLQDVLALVDVAASESPTIVYLAAFVAYVKGDVRTMTDLGIRAVILAGDDLRLRAALLEQVLLMGTQFSEGDRGIAFLTRELEEIPYERSDRILLSAGLGFVFASTGRTAEAARIVAEIEPHFAALDSRERLKVLRLRAVVEYVSGSLEEAVTLARVSLEAHKRDAGPADLARAYAVMTSFSNQAMQGFAPVEYALACAQSAIESGTLVFARSGFASAALVYAVAGRVDEARENLERASRFPVGPKVYTLAFERAARIYLHATRGELRAARDVLYDALVASDLPLLPISRGELMVLDALMLALTDPAGARTYDAMMTKSAALSLQGPHFGGEDFVWTSQGLGLLRSLGYSLYGRWSKAREEIERVRPVPGLAPLRRVAEAVASGPPFLALDERFAALTGQAQGGWFAACAPEVFRSRFGASVASADIGLTAREREVLLALSTGKSNAAIAAASGRSLQTIKSQIASILKKLNAENRVAAIARARELGLL